MPTKASRTHTTTSAMVVVASIRVFTLLRMWKSLRMFSSWLCVCVCVSACLGESFHFFLDFLFFFFWRVRKRKCATAVFLRLRAMDSGCSLIPGCQLVQFSAVQPEFDKPSSQQEPGAPRRVSPHSIIPIPVGCLRSTPICTGL